MSKKCSDIETELVEGSKVDEDKETTELQRLIEVVPNKEEVAIDVIPLATKPPSISSVNNAQSFDMEDLETLWKLVKAKHGSTRPEEGYERVLWGDLKTMFDPHVEDQRLGGITRNSRYWIGSYMIIFEMKLDDFEEESQSLDEVFEIKRLHDDLGVTATKVCVTTAK
ncbi:hypothetical protein Tco_0570590 [Tanacetum coccineum]